MRWHRRLFYFPWLAIACQLIAGTTGKITGVVKDRATGAPIPGANVFIEGTTLGAATGADGSFFIVNIPPGTYSLTAQMMGYSRTTVAGVRVTADLTTRVDFALQETTIDLQEVVVTAERPFIQKDVTSTIAVVDQERIDALPVQSFTEVLATQAGVVARGSTLHIRGGRGNEVGYLIDGMYVEDPLFGGLGTRVNNDAIKELTLLSGTFSAEYGDALSGIVNIVTREGTDLLSGSLETRTSQFGLAPYHDYGEWRTNGYVSGPIFKNRLSYFVSGEQNQRESWLPFGYRREATAFAKLTSRPAPWLKVTMSGRYSETKSQPYNHLWKYIPDQYTRTRSHSRQAILTATHTVSPRMFYDVRLSVFSQDYYSGVDKDTSEYVPPATRQYVPWAGNGYEFYSKADPLQLTKSKTHTVDLKADLVWQIGRQNELKSGFEVKQHRLRLFDIYDPTRDFPYINDYDQKPLEASAYLQDKIEYAYLTVNIGLRFDYANARTKFRANPLDLASERSVKPKWQLSPRIGIAHPVSERTKLHFAYGHFFQNPEYQYFYENRQYDLNVREPLFGQPDLDAEKTVAYETGLAHQFSNSLAAHVTAYYKDVTGLIGTHYYMPYFSGRYVGYTLYVNEDYANIKGFEVNLDYRPRAAVQGSLTYTYSVAKGSASSETEQYPGTQESTLLYYLDFDKTHVLNASLSARFGAKEGPELFGFYPMAHTDWSFMFSASSGFPYTPSGRDVGFVIKNSARMPSNYTLDCEVGRTVRVGGTKIRLFVEVLNLTNFKNVVYVYPDTGEPDFTRQGNHSREYMRDPSNYGPPRRVRVGLGVRL